MSIPTAAGGGRQRPHWLEDQQRRGSIQVACCRRVWPQHPPDPESHCHWLTVFILLTSAWQTCRPGFCSLNRLVFPYKETWHHVWSSWKSGDALVFMILLLEGGSLENIFFYCLSMFLLFCPFNCNARHNSVYHFVWSVPTIGLLNNVFFPFPIVWPSYNLSWLCVKNS